MGKADSIGLVLSGGGAKGAFQVGVWKAMCELGLADRVSVISGTSVGAINGAAFATLRDAEKLCRFWRTKVGDIATPNLTNLVPGQFIVAIKDVLSGKPFPFRGLLDRSALETILSRLLPRRWPEGAPEVYATALECRGCLFGTLDPACYERQCFFLNEELSADNRIKKLLASAAIPWGFDPVDLNGRRYVDGCWAAMGGDNIPVSQILERRPDIRTIIVVRCNCTADEQEAINATIPRGTTLVEIRPRNSLCGPLQVASDLLPDASFLNDVPIVGKLAQGVESITRQIRIWSGTLAFDGEYAKRFIKQGYNEGMTALRQLKPKARLNW